MTKTHIIFCIQTKIEIFILLNNLNQVKKGKSHYIELLIDDYKLDQVKEIIFLGVILDENLTWKSEISHVANKVLKSIGIIRKSNFFLSTKSLRTLIFH